MMSDIDLTGKNKDGVKIQDEPAKAKLAVSGQEADEVALVEAVATMASEMLDKWEFDLFRDALNNVNNTLRFQLSLATPLMAACITVLNIVPPQAHQELLNELDRWVFIPVLLSMVVSYRGLELHWYHHKRRKKLETDLKNLYDLVSSKYRTVHLACLLQGLGLLLFVIFVLLEYK